MKTSQKNLDQALNPIAQKKQLQWGDKKQHFLLLFNCILTILFAKTPLFLQLLEDIFFQRNFAFLFTPGCCVYLLYQNPISTKKTTLLFLFLTFSLYYFNSFNYSYHPSDAQLVAYLHAPILCFFFLGYSYDFQRDKSTLLDFFRLCTETLFIAGLLLIVVFLISALTLALFDLNQLNIEKMYFDFFGLPLLLSIPFLALHITINNPTICTNLVEIATQFLIPLLSLLLILFLITSAFSSTNPFNDRNALLLFNVVLFFAILLIIFNITHNLHQSARYKILLLLLSITTLIINGIALCAIAIRITDWGISVNRIALTGINIILMTHLTLLTLKQFINLKNENYSSKIQQLIYSYLPVYFIWSCIIIFLLPFFF